MLVACEADPVILEDTQRIHRGSQHGYRLCMGHNYSTAQAQGACKNCIQMVFGKSDRLQSC